MNFEGLSAEAKSQGRKAGSQARRRPSRSSNFEQKRLELLLCFGPHMGSKRVFAISSQRRGFGRVAVFLVALAVMVAGCGRSGQGAVTDSDKAADVEVLNTVLSQELTTVDAYRRALVLLRGQISRSRGSCAGRTRPTSTRSPGRFGGGGTKPTRKRPSSNRRVRKARKRRCYSPTKKRTPRSGAALDAAPH